MTVTRLVLWRHGRSTWNAEHRIQGQTDVPLDDTGREQARRAAERLAFLKPGVLISSDLRRAADTAAALAEHTGLEVGFDTRLRERHYGDWQGHTVAEVEQRWPEAFARWRTGGDVDESGVESLDDVAKRVFEALHELVARHVGETVVVTTHGGAARRGIGALLDWPTSVQRSLGELGNCHWCELRHHPDRGWQLRSYNVG